MAGKIKKKNPYLARPTGLGTLFGEESPRRFLEESWPHQPRVFHHPEAHLPEIWSLPDLQSLDSALNIAAPETIFANLPDRDEEYNQVKLVSAEDVKKAFACKMGISMEPDMPKIAELIFWLRSIQRDLGLSKQTYGRCNIYSIPDGGRTGCHYDQNINFVCQITGEKTWDLAPNTHVTNPITRHTADTPPDRSTAAFSNKPLPREMPSKGRIRVVLKRGSVLFVPRGWWHQTSSKGSSISLNFTYDQPNWAQVMSEAICSRLMKNEKWRGVAYGLRQEGALSQRAEAEFEALMRQSGET
ncbi:MAG: cupin-like domain-containing protein, partial [Bdellovibrionota bacterium]